MKNVLFVCLFEREVSLGYHTVRRRMRAMPMGVAQIYFGMIGSRAIVAATIDYAGVGSLIAAIAAFIAMYLSHRTNKRTQVNTESVSYVDTNLKTMQATLEWLKEDNERLRELNEEQRLQIASFREELEQVEEELERCKNSCETLTRRLNSLGAKK